MKQFLLCAKTLMPLAVITLAMCGGLTFAAEPSSETAADPAAVAPRLTIEPAHAATNPPATGPSAQTSTQTGARPKYQMLRLNEDWSVLADKPAGAGGDFFDVIKYIPLNQDGDWWLSFGGQYRARFESWNNFGFNDSNDDDFLLHRIRLHGDLHMGEHFRIFAEGISAISTDRDLPGGRRTLDADSADLLNLFAEFTTPIQLPTFEGDTRLTFRAGRQELLFGKQRLVSPLDWANTRRSFDGLTVSLGNDVFNITGFYTHPVIVQKYEFNDLVQANEFYGIYSTIKLPKLQSTLDVYWLGFHRDAAAFNGTAGEEDRHTLGARLAGKCGSSGFDYDIEAAWQAGKVGSGDINAWMVAAELGYTLTSDKMSPRIWLGLDYATGDNKAGGDVETFNQLFPLGHAYFGYIDAIGRQNIIDASAGVSFKPVKKLNVSLAGHLFWRADEDDALYNAGGGLMRGPTSSDHQVGAEMDLLLKYDVDQHLMLIGGYSHFFTGSFINQTGADDDVDFVHFSVQYTF